MAGTGSRRYFGYTDDDDNSYIVQLDESVYESSDLGMAQSVTPAVAGTPGNLLRATASRPIELRHIYATRTDADGRTVRRKFYVGSPTANAFGTGVRTATIDGQTWAITAKVGEVRHYIPSEDTGLIDGDVDSNVSGA